MAKARPLRKAVRKSGGKANKRPSRSGSARKPATPKGSSRTPTARTRGKLGSGGARKAGVSSSKLSERQAMVPETPPPLPAPIASFTF